jgi:alkylation response protein AidB-like acyl-CoA dehydrogenase
MDFNLNDEQQLLADTVNRLASNYSLANRQKLTATECGFSKENWQKFAELGVLGLNVPQEYGGMGGGPLETAIVMEAIGRALVVEPYLPTAVMAVQGLVCAGTADQRAKFLPGIADGKVRFAVAALEPQGRYELGSISTTARETRRGYLLTGHKAVVLHGAAADQLLVTARIPRSIEPGDSPAVFIVDASAEGVRIKSSPALDGSRTAEIVLEDVAVKHDALLGKPGEGLDLLERIVDRGIAGLCAEAIGAMERLVELTAHYLRTRRQFGQPIAGFQVLQHRIADMRIASEQARSVSLMAAARVDSPDVQTRRRALAAAKTLIGQCGRYIGEQAVQLHGGMGMTDELAVGHFFKRLICIDMSFGDSNYHLERFGELL